MAFGVGAWPALAAAIVAHLLYLLGAHRTSNEQNDRTYNPAATAVRPGPLAPPFVRPPAASPARDRARAAAHAHHARHGRLPTVSELMTLADVARGTAGTALKELRDERPALQIVHVTAQTRTEP